MDKRVIKNLGLLFVNLITTIRLVGALILPVIYYKSGANIVSIYILILFLTDAIDGFLARTFKLSTFFGSFMDASSDKVLNIISFIILGLEYKIMFTPLIIEIAILYTTYSTYRYGGNVKTSKTGKIKTIVLDVLVILSFILLAIPSLKLNSNIINIIINNTNLIISIFSIVILILCMITLLNYLKKNKLARKNPKCIEIKYKEKIRKPIKTIIRQLFDTQYYQKHKTESIMKQLYLE